MALKISHGAFQGGYSQFRYWRNLLGVVAGYALTQVNDGCCGLVEGFDFGDISNDKNLKIGNWSEKPKDPLMILLVHSDTEGHINKEDLIPLMNRMEELLPLVQARSVMTKKPVDSSCVQITQNFIDALSQASTNDEVLMFYNF